MLSSCFGEVNHNSPMKGPDKTPGSWMYEQRAYPLGLNQTAKKNTAKQYKSMITSPQRFNKKWKPVGPINIGGRITDVAMHPTNINILYAGSSVGGLWKSTDNGYNWNLIFDEPGGLSIGNIGLSASNPDVIYLGTGEANASATSGAFFGNGVYKSTDAGLTWTNVGLENSNHIARIVVHPTESDIAYVAATGALYSKNEERGIYKTIDGGNTWDQILFVSDSTSAIDISFSPLSPDTLFAAMWERSRRPEGRNYAGVTSGLYRSTNAGESWQLMTNGIPSNGDSLGRIGVQVSPSDPSLIYATFATHPTTNTFLGIYKSEDSGNTWTGEFNESLSDVYKSFGWFFGNIRVHPITNDPYIVGFRNYIRSEDGLWTPWSSGYHVDQHAYEFHPTTPDFRIFGNDGGIYITQDGGLTIRHIKTLANNQFYECKIHPTLDDTYIAGSQDNGTLMTRGNGIDGYQSINGGDGFVVQYDHVDPRYFYVESQFGNITRLEDTGTNFLRTPISPPISLVERKNWNTPFLTIPNEAGGIIYGGESVLYSNDYGENWQVISSDLTNGSSSSSYATISALAISEVDQNIIVAGTDDGNVHITTDRGLSWDLISEDLPNLTVSSIATHPTNPAIIFVTFSGYRWSDYLPHVLRSEDYGQTWTDISSNLPEMPINELVVDPHFERVYYLATDLGVFVTENAGQLWTILGENMPPVVVNDLDLHDEKRLLLAATFGRSMFTYNLPTSTKTDDDLDNHISLNPNPATDVITLNIQGTVESVSILTMSGQLVAKPEVNNQMIDISILQPDTYILRAVIDSKIFTEKFVKF